MLTMDDITKAINGLIAERYPDDLVYVNLLPKDFARPSTLIEFESVERKPASRWTVEVKASFLVTCFVGTDEHYQSDTEALSDRQSRIMSQFACGYLSVGDRRLEVQSAYGGMDFTESTVSLKLEYFDDTDDGMKLPLMESVDINTVLEG
jgi:hypothetical protein